MYESNSTDANQGNTYTYSVTDSTIFIRPMIGYNSPFYSNTAFYNTYLDTEKRLYYVFNKTKIENEKIRKKYYESVTSFSSNVYYNNRIENDIFHTFIFNVPDEFVNDYYTFLDSKFSKFTAEYKYRVRRFYLSDNKAFQGINEILAASKSRMESLAEQLNVSVDLIKEVGEVRDKIDLSKEIYFENNFKEQGIIYEYYRNKSIENGNKENIGP